MLKQWSSIQPRWSKNMRKTKMLSLMISLIFFINFVRHLSFSTNFWELLFQMSRIKSRLWPKIIKDFQDIKGSLVLSRWRCRKKLFNAIPATIKISRFLRNLKNMILLAEISSGWCGYLLLSVLLLKEWEILLPICLTFCAKLMMLLLEMFITSWSEEELNWLSRQHQTGRNSSKSFLMENTMRKDFQMSARDLWPNSYLYTT